VVSSRDIKWSVKLPTNPTNKVMIMGNIYKITITIEAETKKEAEECISHTRYVIGKYWKLLYGGKVEAINEEVRQCPMEDCRLDCVDCGVSVGYVDFE
jgi:hypothetical protein